MDLHQLRTFLSVESHRNLTKAARELFLTQPAVSRQIRRLEEELGVPLLERLGKTIQLTDAGRTLAREAERVLGGMERAVEAVKAHRDPARGALRIGASTTPGFYLLPAVLGRFHRRYPEVELSFTVENSLRIEEGLIRNKLDLGFVGAPLEAEELRAEPVMEDEIVFFAGPSHRLARQKAVEPRLLRDETWVIREKGSATRELLEGKLAEGGLEMGRTIVLGCPEAIKAVVAAGLGLSFLSRHALREDLRRGRLVHVPLRGFRLARTLSWACHRDKQLSAVQEAFLKMVRSSLARARRRPR